jgi:hypothetical protein
VPGDPVKADVGVVEADLFAGVDGDEGLVIFVE